MSILDELEVGGISIVGMYFASNGPVVPRFVSFLHSQLESTTGRKIKIYQYNADILNKSDNTLVPFTVSHGLRDNVLVDLDEAKDMIFDCVQFGQDIENKVHVTSIFDFEDHLDNPSREWVHV